MGHDIAHPGLTNNFQINARTDMALTYNDISCLENFHCSTLFAVAKSPENNIFEKFNVSEYKMLRKRIIPMILATDMFNHGKVIDNIKNKVKTISDKINGDFTINEKIQKYFKEFTEEQNQAKFDNQQVFLDYFIHASDLAHNTKLFKISLKWVELLSCEFWLQGDLERSMGLDISFLCDRNTTDVPKSQVGFISNMIIPTFNILIDNFPTLSYMVENANTNMNIWKDLQSKGRKRGWTPPKEDAKNDVPKCPVIHNSNSKNVSHTTKNIHKNYINLKKNYVFNNGKSFFEKAKFIVINTGSNN